jgi:hypothetical protein
MSPQEKGIRKKKKVDCYATRVAVASRWLHTLDIRRTWRDFAARFGGRKFGPFSNPCDNRAAG